jgi:hypothetical protein
LNIRGDKSIKKIAKIGLIVVLVFLTIPALSLLFLQNRQVQTLVTKYVAERLSEELMTSISLSSINYSFFKRVHIQDLYLEDLHGDTLIYSELTEVRLKQLFPGKKGMEIKKITVENFWLNLVIDSSSAVNIKYFTDMISKPHVPPERKGRFHIAKIELINGRFSLSNMVKKESKNEINFTDYDLGNLQIRVNDLISERDTVSMDIISLATREKSGFEITKLSSFMSLGKAHMHFEGLDILTDGSTLEVPELRFNFDHFRDFKYFSSKVNWVFESNQSTLKIRDLAYHASATMGMLDHIDIDGKAFGKLNDLRGEDLVMTFDQKSTLAFDFVMIGLPQFKNTFLEFNFREFNTSVGGLNDLVGEIQNTSRDLLYPWNNLGNLDFRGRFTGYPDDFVASGLLNTDMGGMVMDLSFKPDSSNRLKFNGHLKTNDFSLGAFLEQEEVLSELDMDVYADGSLTNGQIEARLNGNIDSLEFYEYAYSNITLDGAFTNNTFDGGVSISDPNIRMDFEGKMDFSGEVPVYNFTADVARARPYYLKLGNEEPNTFASFLIETDLSGKTLDEMNGEIRVVNSLFSRGDALVQLYDFHISTSNTPEYSEILVNSEMFDAHIQGQYKLSGLPASFKNLADRYMNVDVENEPFVDSLTRFTYQFDFKRVNPLLDYFYPELQIGDHSQFRGTFDPSIDNSTSYGTFSNFQFRNNKWTNVELSTEIRDEDFQVHFVSDSLSYGQSVSLVDHQFQFRAANDTAFLHTLWDNQEDPSFKGSIDLTGTLESDSLKNKGFFIQVSPTDLYINNDLWRLSRSAVLVRKQYVRIDSLMIKNKDRYLLADGYISSNDDQALDMEVNNMNLYDLSNLAGLNAVLTGNISGSANFQKLGGVPYIFSDLTVDTLIFNDQMLGATQLNADWDDSNGSINIALNSETGGVKLLDVDGAFSPSSRKLDFDIHMDNIKLQTLNTYVGNGLKDISGEVDVNLTLDGTLDKPELNGTLNLDQGEATVSFLNTHYIFNDQARIYHNNVYLEDFIALDEQGNSARITGTLTNSYFKDFRTNFNIEANNLMCLNTTSVDNDVVYGSIFATGNVGIAGPFDAIKIDVKATTEPNTAIFLPLYTAREVQSSDFISFVLKDDVKKGTDPLGTKKIGGLEMELDLDVTDAAKVQMIFDPKLGDIIETSGQGNLRILLDKTSGFTMFGDVELLKGDYLFTLQNVINKRFEIEPGGKILFNGSPTDASIDLEAIYTTRTAPYNLYPGDPSEAEQLKKRIPVECRLNLLGELQSPIISTGIELPTADAKTRELLTSATRTEEELMKQFISLLVINNFYSVSGYGGGDIGGVNSSVAGVTASELLSNQLTNWLSQISDDFDIGVNYRPGDQVTRDQVELALSTQLLNDRIILSGNVDVGGQETNPSSGAANNPYIMGDFDVEFRLTDNVSLIAFNRARDELLYETAPYKQGVGISYREEFNNFKQLRTRYKEGLSNRKKKKKKSQEPDLEE